MTLRSRALFLPVFGLGATATAYAEPHALVLQSDFGLKAGAVAAMVYSEVRPWVKRFGAVPEGEPLLYLNSLLNISLALNQSSFAEKFSVRAGADWLVEIEKEPR